MDEFLHHQFLSNSIGRYLVVAGIILVALLSRNLLSKAINYILFRMLPRFASEGRLQEFQAQVLRPMQWLLVFLVIVIALESLQYPDAWKVEFLDMPLQEMLGKLLWAVVLFFLMKVLLSLVDFISISFHRKAIATDSRSDDQLVPFVKDAVKVLIYIFFIFILLGVVFNLNITSLLAGLGIGGLAIAFAAQESIKDLFGSITIFLDKPFTVGDIVKVGDVEGTVERVGFRSTRIRTYDQSLITLPNKKMMDTNVDNLTLRRYRRVRNVIRLSYDSSPQQLRMIIDAMRTYFRNHPHFNRMEPNIVLDEFSETSINILLIYFIPILEPDQHLTLKEEANFKIMEIVGNHEAAFATAVREIKLTPDSFTSIPHPVPPQPS